MPETPNKTLEPKKLDESPDSAGLTPAVSSEGTPAARARGLAGWISDVVLATRKKIGAESASASADAPDLVDLLLEGPDALVVVDTERGEIVEASRRFEEWTGLARDDLLDRPILTLFAESEHKVVRTLYEDAGAGGVHVVEIKNTKDQDLSKLIEFTARRSQSGSGGFALLVGRDLGERASSERYLRAERDRLTTFIRAMRDGLVLLTATGEIQYTNPAMETFFEPFALTAICHRWLKAFALDDRSDLQGLTSAYEGKTLTLDSGDGRTFMVTRSFLFETGKPALVMMMVKDVTDQTLIEDQNHQLELELARESKLAEFGMLVAGIAHNLNGPLTGILGTCELLKFKGLETKEIEQVRKQANIMRDLIGNLLHKSRSEAEMEPRDLDLRELLDTEIKFLDANLFFKHQVTKQIEIAEELPTIIGVYSDLSQVFGNILRNAIDAMHQAPVKELFLKCSADQKSIYVEIRDTGVGMSSDVRDKIFDAFFTTKPKRTEAEPGAPVGTGLGLSSTRNILARYGATIDVQSQPGKGATFTVRIPLGRRPDLLPRS